MRSIRFDKWAAAVGLVFVACALLLVFTKRPWVDEAWFTSPGLDLVTRGRFGTLLLDPLGSHLRLGKPDAVLLGINEHTFWVMPLHLLQLALWGKIFGFSVFSMRMPGVLWGLVTLWSTAVVVRRLYGDRGAALLAAAVLAVSVGFVNGAADVRMDVTCVALGMAALAVFLSWRERSFDRAVLAGFALAAASMFTHPNGLYFSLGLWVVMMWLDGKRVGPITIVIAAIPYVVLGLGWAMYCTRFPAEFKAQITANAADRGVDLLAPWRGVWREITGRFVGYFWPEGSVAGKIKVVGLVAYLAGLGTVAGSSDLRRLSGCRLVLALTLLQFLCLSILASNKGGYYMVYILPYFAIATGIGLSYWWVSGRKVACAGALGLFAAVQLAAIASLGPGTSGYRKEYAPAVRYLREHVGAGDLVCGPSEFGFALGFRNPQWADDVWLGHWSGRKPTVVVLDRWFYDEVIKTAEQRGIPYHGYFDETLKQFRVVQDGPGYRIYRRVE